MTAAGFLLAATFATAPTGAPAETSCSSSTPSRRRPPRGGLRLRRRRRRLPAHPAVLAAALAAAAFALIPVGFVLIVLVQTGWDTAIG